MLNMTRTCNMVKIWGSKKRYLSTVKRKLNENMGEFITFVEIGNINKFCGNRKTCKMRRWLRGDGSLSVFV